MRLRNSYRALFVAVALVSTARAGSISWINPIGGDFSTASNWLPLAVPGGSDSANFNTAALLPYTVSFSSSPTNSQLIMGTDNVTFDLQGHTYNLTSNQYAAPGYSVEIGNLGIATLNLGSSTNSGGTLNTNYGSIGVSLGDTGTVNVSGPKVAWKSQQDIHIGDGGAGTLNILNGGSVSDAVGAIGNTATGIGAVNISGGRWTNSSYLLVGNYGLGQLTIQNGGSASSDVGYVGQFGPGIATITGAGTSWNTNLLNVGYAATGTLSIVNGASLSDSSAAVGVSPNAIGTIIINGNGTKWNTSGTVMLGVAAPSTVTINAGTMSIGRLLSIKNIPGNQINLKGGTIRIGALDTNSNPGSILGNGITTGWTAGTLDITNSDLSISSDGPLGSSLTLSPNKTFSVSGSGHTLTVASDGTLNAGGGNVYANTLNNAGTISLPTGSSLEVVNPMVNTGLIDLSGGKLQLDAGLAGDESLRAEIDEAYDNGKWDGATGISSSIAAEDVRGATGIGYVTQGNQTTLMYTWYGDANGDGVVNQQDFALMNSAGTTWQTGDFNYDGIVNADDWALFQLGLAYGATQPVGNSVPEPGALGLLAIGTLAMCRRRRRRV